jgi:nitrite reductase (NADH) large subunit
VQLKVSGVELFAAGAMPFPADAESQVLQDAARGIYRRLVFAGGRLVGAILLGDRRGGSWYGELIAAGQDVSALRPRLIFGREFCEAPADAAA